MWGLFVVGLLAGGATSGAIAWLLSGLTEPLPSSWRAPLLVALAATGLLRDLGLVTFRLPQRAQLIPRRVFEADLRRGFLRFGFELGTGLRTYVTSSAAYVALAAVLLLRPSLGVALLAGVGFGFGRALVILWPVLTGTSAAGLKAVSERAAAIKLSQSTLVLLASVVLASRLA